MILIPLMGIIWPMLALIIFVYMHYSSKNKIRMALIESGRDASIFRSRKKVDRLRTLKNGVVSLMVGLGVMVGYLMNQIAGIPEEVALVSSIFLFIGMGLIAFYAYAMKQPISEEVSEMV